MAADAVLVDKAGAAEKAKVLGDSGTGDRESAGDLSGGLMAVAKEVQDGAAGGVRECAEDGVGRMSNRMVSHNV